MKLLLEPQMGIEPTTYSLRVNCSTPEPLWQVLLDFSKDMYKIQVEM